MTAPLIDLPDFIGTVYILHLGRAIDRKPQVAHLRQLFGEKTICFDATDSQHLNEQMIDTVYRHNLHAPHYPFALSHNEVACFMSHRAIWRAIADGDGRSALVLEDDVAVDNARLSAAMALVDGAICATSYCRLPEQKRSVADSLKPAVTQPTLPGLGMQAQIVSPVAAAKLLQFTERFDRPVDTTLQMRWLHDVPMMELFPSGVTEIDQHLGGTTIQRKNRPLGEKLKRNVLRAYYRSHIRLNSVLNNSEKY